MTASPNRQLVSISLLATAAIALASTVYLSTQPSRQKIPSVAQNSCTASVAVKFNHTEPVQVGNLIKLPVYAHLNQAPLGIAAITINYNPTQLELDPSLARPQGNEMFASAENYAHDPNLDLKSSAIFALPDAKKLHVLASCEYRQDINGKISCDPSRSVWGERVDGQQEILLATLPLRVIGIGRISLTPENDECRTETSQSVLLDALSDLNLSADQLGSAEGTSLCGMNINLDGSTDPNGNPTFSALDFRQWLVYFRKYILEDEFSAAADFNCDGKINALDFSVFLREFRRHLR